MATGSFKGNRHWVRLPWCAKAFLLKNRKASPMFKRNSAEAAGQLAHNFYDQPSQKLKLVGVTGTNGKTTIATLLYKLFTCLGYKCGLISTVENRSKEKLFRPRIPHRMP
jgi:UDP-N-acetylmuramyl tripeptide synthase